MSNINHHHHNSSSTSNSSIDKRLQDLLISHECSLSNLNLSAVQFQNEQQPTIHAARTSISSTVTVSRTTKNTSSTNGNGNDNGNSNSHSTSADSSLALAALHRSINVSTNSVSVSGVLLCDQDSPCTSKLVDLNLNPPERVSPQDLLIHDKSFLLASSLSAQPAAVVDYNNSNKNNTVISSDRIVHAPSLVLKTITVLSTLCDEAHELHSVGMTKIIPRIYLFAHDLLGLTQHDSDDNVDNNDGDSHSHSNNIFGDNNSNENENKHKTSQPMNHQSNTTTTTTTTTETLLFNQSILAKRDSILLQRISKFIIHLQSTQNYVLRCQKLIRNILCQIHGSLSPIGVQLQQHDHEHNGDMTSDYDDNEDYGNNGQHIHDNDDDDDDDDEDNHTNGSRSSSSQRSQSVPLFIRPKTNHNTNNTKNINTTTTSSTTKELESNHTKTHNTTANRTTTTTTTTNISAPPMFHKSYHLTILGEAISKLLSILITIDTIIMHNLDIHEAWDLYKSIVTERAEKLEEKVAASAKIAAARSTAKTFGSDSLSSSSNNITNCEHEHKEEDDDDDDDEECRLKLIQLERMIMQIDFTLLSSRSFLICIEQNFDPRNRFGLNHDINIHNLQSEDHHGKDSYYNNRKKKSENDAKNGVFPYPSKPLYEHIKIILTTLYERYCSVINTPNEHTEREDMVGLYGLYCLYRRLVPSNKVPDEKLHKALCTVFPSTHPVIPLYGNASFMPLDFITKYAPLDIARGMRNRSRAPRREEIMDSAKELLEKQDKTFCKKVSLLYDEGLAWLLQAETDLAPSERTNNTMLFEDGNGQHDMMLTPSDHENSHSMNTVKYKTDIILRGLKIARRSTVTLRNYLFLHKFLQVPIGSKHLLAIEQLCSIAKSVEKTLAGRRRSSIVSIHKAALKMLASSLYSCFDKLR